MAHLPHVFLPGPWEADVFSLTDAQTHHLRRVLRMVDHASVSYTDGAGSVGKGTLVPEGIRRGEESNHPKPAPALTVAVAPPQSLDRARFVVEKLGELGVDRLRWLITDHGQAGVPRPEKTARWAVGALEQSRGAWLMAIDGGSTLADLPPPTWVIHLEGGTLPAPTDGITLAVGPEGGFSSEELSRADTTVGLGARVLRVETAAVVASGLVLRHLGRMNT